MMTLDNCRWSLERDTFNNIGIKSTLCKKFRVCYLSCLLFKNGNKFIADDLSLPLRLNDPGKFFKKSRPRIHVVELYTEMALKSLPYFLSFTFPQKTVINEYAGESVAYCLMYKQSNNRRIDTAAQGADH